MARYTDIDKLIAEYDRVHVGAPGGARKLMVEAPIADVEPRSEVGEPLEDLLVEFDEFGMQPTILVPDPEGMAIKWKRKLEYAIGHLKADTAREIFEEIEYLIWQNDTHPASELTEDIAELKNKYAEGRNER